jgi:hypothetical protein
MISAASATSCESQCANRSRSRETKTSFKLVAGVCDPGFPFWRANGEPNGSPVVVSDRARERAANLFLAMLNVRILTIR